MKDEREELVETYRDMATEELLDHWESGTLTELAIQLASEEFTRRGVTAPPLPQMTEEEGQEAPGDEAVFETIARSHAPTEMQILRGRLEADGIPAFVVDDNINETNSVLAEHGGIGLQVPIQYATEAKRIVAEVKSGDLEIDDTAPEPQAPEEVAETPTPAWEFLVTAAVFTFASFEFVRTMWFARTFNTDIEWDTVSFLALALPILFFIGALLLVFRSKWALPCFAIHLPLNIVPAFVLTPDETLQVNQFIGWICTAGIIYFCLHLRKQGRIG